MVTSIRLDQVTEERLNNLAAQTGRTKAFYLRELVQRGLEDMEDYYKASLIMERVHKGEEPIYSAENVRRDLGLDD